MSRRRHTARNQLHVLWLGVWAVVAVHAVAAAQPIGNLPAAPTAAARSFSFGVVPTHSLTQLESFYGPLANFLGSALHRSVLFGTSSTYARFRERLARGDFDVVFLQASDYQRIARPHGYRSLVQLVGSSATVFIVAPDSPTRTLNDLRGAAVALPPAEADSTPIALRRLQDIGIDGASEQLLYVAQHNACVQYVLTGRAAACATVRYALDMIGLQRGVDYRIIETADDTADDAPAPLFAAAPTLSAEDRAALTAALLAWPDQSARHGGPNNLDWVQMVPASDADAQAQPSDAPH